MKITDELKAGIFQTAALLNEHGTMTPPQIEKALNLSKSHVQNILVLMRSERVAPPFRVRRLSPARGRIPAVFELSDLPDVVPVRLKRLSNDVRRTVAKRTVFHVPASERPAPVESEGLDMCSFWIPRRGES